MTIPYPGTLSLVGVGFLVLLRACLYGRGLLTTGCSGGGVPGPLPHPRPCHRTDHAAATLCVLEVQRHRGVRRQLVGGTSVCGHDLGKRCVWLAKWHFCGIMSTARCFPCPTTRPNPACAPYGAVGRHPWGGTRQCVLDACCVHDTIGLGGQLLLCCQSRTPSPQVALPWAMASWRACPSIPPCSLSPNESLRT